MTDDFVCALATRLKVVNSDGTFSHEGVIVSPQQGAVTLEDGTSHINLCADY